MYKGGVVRASKSPSSAKALFVKTSVVKFGTDCCIDGWIAWIVLFARIRVRNLGDRGKLESAVRELSVRSIVSCWSCKINPTRYTRRIGREDRVHPHGA